MRSLILLFFLLVVGLFTVPVNQGHSLFDWRPVQAHWAQPSRWPTMAQAVWAGAVGSSETMVYRWRDGAGNWQYGQTPPPGVQAQAVTVGPTTRISREALIGVPAGEQEQKP